MPALEAVTSRMPLSFPACSNRASFCLVVRRMVRQRFVDEPRRISPIPSPQSSEEAVGPPREKQQKGTEPMRRLLTLLISCLFGFGATELRAAEPFFMRLGFLDGGNLSANNTMSADGTVVVGAAASSNGSQAFRWSLDTGMENLYDLIGQPTGSIATGVSADGSVIVGGTNNLGAFYLSGNTLTLFAPRNVRGISGDGSVIAGAVQTSQTVPAMFDASNNFAATQLGLLPGHITGGAVAVSQDGNVIVGSTSVGTEASLAAFRWTKTEGISSLNAGTASTAVAASLDGSVIVGQRAHPNGTEAFRWENGVTVGLGDLDGGSFFSRAADVSDDGSIVVGLAITDLGGEGFIWDEANGMRNLQQVLETDFGLEGSLQGWTLRSANAISADGLTITGEGINPDGNQEAWIATLDAPTTTAEKRRDNRRPQRCLPHLCQPQRCRPSRCRPQRCQPQWCGVRQHGFHIRRPFQREGAGDGFSPSPQCD